MENHKAKHAEKVIKGYELGYDAAKIEARRRNVEMS
jgi:hypothetical protein